MVYVDPWWSTVVHGGPRWSMVVHGDPWCMVVHGGPWWRMAYGDPWWYMVYGGTWWFMVVHGIWWSMVGLQLLAAILAAMGPTRILLYVHVHPAPLGAFCIMPQRGAIHVSIFLLFCPNGRGNASDKLMVHGWQSSPRYCEQICPCSPDVLACSCQFVIALPEGCRAQPFAPAR